MKLNEMFRLKKCFVIVITFILFLCSCSSETDDWKEVKIEKCGTIKIPNHWTFLIEDEIMYILENETPIMISYQRTGESQSNSYVSDFKYIEFTTSAVFSNSAIYGKAKYFLGDKGTVLSSPENNI